MTPNQQNVLQSIILVSVGGTVIAVSAIIYHRRNRDNEKKHEGKVLSKLS